MTESERADGQSFEILGALRDVEVIASGRGVRTRQYLDRRFGKGRWRKMKGFGTARQYDGRLIEAEFHWYEAHGVGRVLIKRKRILRYL